MVWDIGGFPFVCQRQDGRWWLLRPKHDIGLDQEQTPLEIHAHYLSMPIPLGHLKHATIAKGIVLAYQKWESEYKA